MNLTKEHILLVSFKLFLNKGYKDVSMSMIVNATGLSKGGIYYYFKNKEQLFFDTIDNLYLSILPFEKEMLLNHEVSFFDYMQMYIDNIKRVSKIMSGYMGDNSLGMGHLRLMLDVVNYAPEFRSKIEEVKRNEFSFLSKVLENGIKKDEIRSDLDSEIVAKQFQCLQDGIVLNSLFFDNLDVLYLNVDKALKQLYNLVRK